MWGDITACPAPTSVRFITLRRKTLMRNYKENNIVCMHFSEPLKRKERRFSGGLMVRILGFHCWGPGSVPGWGTEIPQAGCVAKKKNF